MTNKKAIRILENIEYYLKTHTNESCEEEHTALTLAIKALGERPQGEWIAREDMDYLDENKVVHKHFECNKCGLIHDFIDGHTSQYNFCPQCGADMRGGAE